MGWLDEPSYIHLPGARRHFVDEVGEGFWYGMVGGSAWHFLRGLRHSPTGDRLAGGARAVRMNAPRIAGSCASFWGVWFVFENAFFFARRKDDPWNIIASCAASSAFVELRRGARVAGRSALVNGAVFALAEGLCIWCDKHVAATPAPTVEFPPPVHVPARHVPVPKPRGFLGIPPRAPMVEEVPAADLGY